MKKEVIKLEIVSGTEGKSVYLNDYRVCGPKPWGGGIVSIVFDVKKDEIVKALDLLQAKPKCKTCRGMGFIPNEKSVGGFMANDQLKPCPDCPPKEPKPTCKTCGDTKQVGEEIIVHGRSMGWKLCPDCSKEPKERQIGYGKTPLEAISNAMQAKPTCEDAAGDRPPIDCPKCKRLDAMEWDKRAKVYICIYDDYVVRPNKPKCETCGGLKIVCKKGLVNGGIAESCPDCQKEPKPDVKTEPITPMPKKYWDKFHNACTDPCDMLIGPCACGAWHHLRDWKDKIDDPQKYLKPDTENLVENITDIINKDFTVVCNYHDGIKADDIIAILHTARGCIEQQAEQIEAYKNCTKDHQEKCPDAKCWVQVLRDEQMDEIEQLEAKLAEEKAEREIEKTVDDEAILGYREENKQQADFLSLAKEQMDADQAKIKELELAADLTKYTKEQLQENGQLKKQIAELKNRISAIQKQYNEEVMHFCDNKPPKLFSGFNACLSCNLRETCRILYKPEQVELKAKLEAE